MLLFPCGVNESFQPEFPAWCESIYIPMNVYHSRASSGSGERGREKMAVSSSPPFLVPNWSGAHQSLGTVHGIPSQRGRCGRAYMLQKNGHCELAGWGLERKGLGVDQGSQVIGG